MLEAFFDLVRDTVARADFPLVVPDSEAVGAEAFGEGADDGFVFGAVVEEDVEGEILSHRLSGHLTK